MLAKNIMNEASNGAENYKKSVKTRTKIYVVMMVLGLATAVLGYANEAYQFVKISDLMNGFYGGVGSALTAIGIIRIISNVRLLKDEEKLKKNRLQETDERNCAIRKKAVIVSGYLTIILAYLGMIVGGLFSVQVFYTCFVIAMFFLLTIVITSVIYSKKM